MITLRCLSTILQPHTMLVMLVLFVAATAHQTVAADDTPSPAPTPEATRIYDHKLTVVRTIVDTTLPPTSFDISAYEGQMTSFLVGIQEVRRFLHAASPQTSFQCIVLRRPRINSDRAKSLIVDGYCNCSVAVASRQRRGDNTTATANTTTVTTASTLAPATTSSSSSSVCPSPYDSEKHIAELFATTAQQEKDDPTSFMVMSKVFRIELREESSTADDGSGGSVTTVGFNHHDAMSDKHKVEDAVAIAIGAVLAVGLVGVVAFCLTNARNARLEREEEERRHAELSQQLVDHQEMTEMLGLNSGGGGGDEGDGAERAPRPAVERSSPIATIYASDL